MAIHRRMSLRRHVKNKPQSSFHPESTNPVYSKSYARTQKWKLIAFTALMSFVMLFSYVRPVKASWDNGAMIITNDIKLHAAMQAFMQKMQDAAQAMLFKFMENLIMQQLTDFLTKTLGKEFGNLVMRQLMATTVSNATIGAAKKQVISTVKDQRALAEIQDQFQRRYPEGVFGDTDSTGAGGTAGPVIAAHEKMADIAEDALRRQAARQDLALGKDKRPGALPNSQEMAKTSEDAVEATSKSQAKAASDGMEILNPAFTPVAEELLFDAVFVATNIDFGQYKITNPETRRRLSVFLTPQPIIPANAQPAYEKDALPEDRLGVLINVMMGQGSIPLLPAEMLNKPNAKALQLKLWTKFSRLQLARQTLTWTMMPSTHSVMQQEYEEFVLSPNDEYAANLNYESKLLKMMRLSQGTNMSLMRLREIQMDQSRLLAVMLTSILEQNQKEEDYTSGAVSR